jgi:predicted NBD/HSP70 family sugar kinase
MIVKGIVAPLEVSHLPHKKGTYEHYIGRGGLERNGQKKWRRHVADVVGRLIAALQPDDTVIGGGNINTLKSLPPRCRQVKAAQARGDFDVLVQRNRHALRVHLGPDIATGLGTLRTALLRALARGHATL